MSVLPLHRISLLAVVFAALALAAPAANADSVPPANIDPPTASSNFAITCGEDAPGCVGDTITGDRGTWTDENSLSFHYEWLRCAQTCNVLSSFDGADDTAQRITVTPEMYREGLAFRVYATGPGGTTVETSEIIGPFNRGPATVPVPQVAPSIDLRDSGVPLSGQQLIGRIGTWDDSYRDYYYNVAWLRCQADGMNCVTLNQRWLDGPNDPVFYGMQAADVGYTIRLQVAAQSDAGYKMVLSAPSAVIQNGGPPVNLAPPLLLVGSIGNPARPVSGPVSVGDTLTATSGSWTINDNLSVNWLRCDRAGTNCVSIPGADSLPGQPARQSYQIPLADYGYSVRADVTASAYLGSATLRTPAARIGPDPTDTGGGSTGGGSTTKDRATVKVRSTKVTGSGETLAVYLSLGAAGKVTVSAKNGSTTLGKTSRKLGKGKVAIAVKLTKAGRKIFKSGKKVKTTLSFTLSTDAGGKGSLKQSVTLRGSR